MAVGKKAVPEELLDSLLADYRKPEDLIGENGLLKQLTKLLVEKALEAEMADHLGHGKNEPVENLAGNTRNGKSKKTLKGEFGELPIEIPRDRHGTCPDRGRGAHLGARRAVAHRRDPRRVAGPALDRAPGHHPGRPGRGLPP